MQARNLLFDLFTHQILRYPSGGKLDRSRAYALSHCAKKPKPLMKALGFIAAFPGGKSIEIPWVALVCLPSDFDPVVEIASLRASEFNRFQKRPTENHKDLRVGNLVPNRIQAIIEICGILRTATVLFRMACHTPIERCCALMFLDAFAAPKSTTAQVSFNRTTRVTSPRKPVP
jgi:hypothetical protein